MVGQYQFFRCIHILSEYSGGVFRFDAALSKVAEKRVPVYIYSLIMLILFSTQSVFAEGSDSADSSSQAEKPEARFINLTAKKLLSRKKVKSKAEYQRTEGGVHYNRDDKIDHLKLIVVINNRNKVPMKGYVLKVEIYARSVTVRKPPPDLYKDFSNELKEIPARKKFTAEFKTEMLYDKSEDIMDRGEPNGRSRIYRTPAFGKNFYGYRILLYDPDGKVVKTLLWPSSLKKALDKLQNKTE